MNRWMTLVALAFPFTVAAQEGTAQYVPEAELAQSAEPTKGWDGALSLAANVALTSNDSVVGQVDGVSLLLGFSLLGGLDYVVGSHEIRNTLTLTQAWSKTPANDRFIKNNDVLDVESLYNFFFIPELGAFARLNAETPILPTSDLRGSPVTYNVTRKDGTVDVRANLTELALASAFQPLTLAESAGLFYQPIKSEAASVSFRGGIGARETFASGALLITDATGNTVNARELDNVFQGGAELFAGVKGKLMERRLNYSAGANVLFPVLNNDAMDRKVLDLTVFGANAQFGFSVFEWMSVSYQLRVRRDPQLTADAQVQNNLLVTFRYDFIQRGGDEAPANPLEAARKAADEAREKARKAKDEADAAQQKLDLLEGGRDGAKGGTPPTPAIPEAAATP